MKEFIVKFLGDDIFESGEMKTDKINFRTEVVDACKMNYCGRYNANWMCPPGVGTLDSLKEKCFKYSNAFIFTTKWDLEDSFDFEGMMAAQEKHDEITRKLFFELKKSADREFKILGAGSCTICPKCSYPDNPCRFPEKAFPSMEACGMQVSELAKELNINYINGQNTVTYFSAVLYN